MRVDKLFEDDRINKRLISLSRSTLQDPINRAFMPPSPQQAITPEPEKKTKSKSKDFKIDFKDDGGYYKVKVKSSDKGVRYNYGHYEQEKLPDIQFNLESLSPNGRKQYEELKKFIAAVNKSKEQEIEEALKLDYEKYERSRPEGGGINTRRIAKIRHKQHGKTYYKKGYIGAIKDWSGRRKWLSDDTLIGFVEYVGYKIMQHIGRHSHYVEVPRVIKLSFEELGGMGYNKDGQFNVTTSSFKRNVAKPNVDSKVYLNVKDMTEMYYALIGNMDFHSENIVRKKLKQGHGKAGHYLIDFERAFLSRKKLRPDGFVAGMVDRWKDSGSVGFVTRKKIVDELRNYFEATKLEDMKSIIKEAAREAVKLIRAEGREEYLKNEIITAASRIYLFIKRQKVNIDEAVSAALSKIEDERQKELGRT